MPGATRQREREVEFAVPTDLEVPDLREIVGGTERLPEQRLSDAYFDTGDLRLWGQGITLRHRVEGGPRGPRQTGIWTLALPDPMVKKAGRRELSWVGHRMEIPAEARLILRGLVRRATVESVTELVTNRRRLLLRNRSGETWAEVDDDTVTVHNGPQDGLTFRQLRVDLLGSDRDQLDPVLAELRQAGARHEGADTLGEVLGAGPAEQGDHIRDAEQASIAATVAATIASDLDRLLDHDVALRLSERHPPVRAVHQARIATRRLRSDLKTLAPTLDPVWVRHTRAELKQVGEVLGLIRDADVLTQRLGLTDEAGETDGTGTLARRLRNERDQAAVTLAEVIGSDQYLNLLDRLHACSLRPPLLPISDEQRNSSGTKSAEGLPPLVHEQWKTLRRRVRKAGSHPSDHRLHRIRIAAKQLRYASELSEPIVGGPARRTAAAAKDLQDVLGDHHDMVTAEAWLRDTGRALPADPATAFEAGLLTAEQQRGAKKLRGEWPAAWKKAKRKKNRRWMR